MDLPKDILGLYALRAVKFSKQTKNTKNIIRRNMEQDGCVVLLQDLEAQKDDAYLEYDKARTAYLDCKTMLEGFEDDFNLAFEECQRAMEVYTREKVRQRKLSAAAQTEFEETNTDVATDRPSRRRDDEPAGGFSVTEESSSVCGHKISGSRNAFGLTTESGEAAICRNRPERTVYSGTTKEQRNRDRRQNS